MSRIVIALCVAMTSSSTLAADQPSSPLRRHINARHSTARPLRRRLTNGASCNGSLDGSFAFDANTTFTTNNVTKFGESNLAAAQDSGVFEGNENTVCDLFSAIGGGGENVVSSGTGNTPDGAENSFIGAGLYNALSSLDAFDGAGVANSVSGMGAFDGAGYQNVTSGLYAATGAGYDNLSSGTYSFDGAGSNNEAEQSDSFVGAGSENEASANYGFIGAGVANTVLGQGSFIGAGGALSTRAPYNEVFGSDSFIGAGDQNVIDSNDAFVGSGVLNNMTAAASDSVLVGGYGNSMSGQKAALGGGESNDVSGSFATIPGGYHNEALGNESFVAGSQAEARYTGSFVWSDYVSSEKPVADSRAGEFVARASGGVYFFSNAGSSAGVHLAAGSGTWSSLSDRNVKTAIEPLDDASILAKVASLPISAWQYKTERGVRHVGPMAQDFYAAFGVGEDDRHITSIDEDGVALAAIKALDAKIRLENGALRNDNRELHEENAALDVRLAALEATVTAMNESKR